MLPSRSTGSRRQLDVVIRAKQAGHEVIVSVEAMARSRKADENWREPPASAWFAADDRDILHGEGTV
jgi:hypothetical protein